MNLNLHIFNTLSRNKEKFAPIQPPYVGMYVCGPTVYGDAHLGHARPAITFDLIYRYLEHIGYKVRYVRNITDVGHLENDADSGEDKIAKKARLENLEPMEVAQYYTVRYHENMNQLNVKNPSIEPRASGHLIEQIEMIKNIIEKGYAYVSEGSVYFDVNKYNDNFLYGKLSGRVLDNLLSTTRDLEGQHEKKNTADFALWKKAHPEHIMRWPSPWSDGFPGWHTECSAMSAKYLGEYFDIHGGGMDLLFPHNESEIAQSQIAHNSEPCKYWLHNNMITINGKKMGKSLGNFITLNEFFSGNHLALEKAYNPMTIRFFILQAHYRSTLDFSNEALQAAEKGLKRLMTGIEIISKLKISAQSSVNIDKIISDSYAAMDDDFNSPIVIANLFEVIRIINSINDCKDSISKDDYEKLKNFFFTFMFEILGLKKDNENNQFQTIEGLMNMIIDFRQSAKLKKDYSTSDKIRNDLAKIGITIKDGKDGSTWNLE